MTKENEAGSLSSEASALARAEVVWAWAEGSAVRMLWSGKMECGLEVVVVGAAKELDIGGK